ncbi:MAG: DUF6049 family protein [Sporichthyaceae bacterium]
MVSTVPARHRRGRAVHGFLAALLGVPLALGFPVGLAGPAAAADPLASIELTTLDPAIGVPGARLRASGVVHVTGKLTLTEIEVRLRLSRTRLSSRGELTAVAAGKTSSTDGDIIARESLRGRFGAGQQTNFDISVALNGIATLREFGVHVLNVEVVARSRDGVGRAAIVRTFLPWVPAHRDFKPAGFAWLWPLTAAPAQLADGRYGDERLAGELELGGRLDRITAAGARLGQQVPLTWVVDPALLESAADMSDGYQIRPQDPSQPDVVGTGSAAAARWLDQVRTATRLGDVATVPYANPDLVALRRGGLIGDVLAARAQGDAMAVELLGHDVITDLAWPADGYADRATLRTLRGTGTQAVVLDARAIPTELTLPFTPTGRADISTRNGRVNGLLADPTLSATLAAGANQAPLLAAQRFVAETAMITAELPGVGPERTILIAPPLHWSPPPELLDRVVSASLQAPWMSPVAVRDLRAAKAPEIDRQALLYPASVRGRELPAAYQDAVRDLHRTIATFAAVLTTPETAVPTLDLAVFRLESSWWRGRDDRLGRLTNTRGHVLDLRDEVQVLPGSYTFGSKSGTIPLTVSNGLTQPVTVKIGLTPSPPRLEVGTVGPVRIPAKSKVQVEVPATAIANGPVRISTVLLTPAGDQYGQPVQLRIQVTQYGTVALGITGVAAGVLFAAAGYRLFRRAAAARRTAGSPGAGTS